MLVDSFEQVEILDVSAGLGPTRKSPVLHRSVKRSWNSKQDG